MKLVAIATSPLVLLTTGLAHASPLDLLMPHHWTCSCLTTGLAHASPLDLLMPHHWTCLCLTTGLAFAATQSHRLPSVSVSSCCNPGRIGQEHPANERRADCAELDQKCFIHRDIETGPNRAIERACIIAHDWCPAWNMRLSRYHSERMCAYIG